MLKVFPIQGMSHSLGTSWVPSVRVARRHSFPVQVRIEAAQSLKEPDLKGSNGWKE